MSQSPASPGGGPPPHENVASAPHRTIGQLEFLITSGLDALAALQQLSTQNPEAAKLLEQVVSQYKKIRGSVPCEPTPSPTK